jgi:hypothetical protein
MSVLACHMSTLCMGGIHMGTLCCADDCMSTQPNQFLFLADLSDGTPPEELIDQSPNMFRYLCTSFMILITRKETLPMASLTLKVALYIGFCFCVSSPPPSKLWSPVDGQYLLIALCELIYSFNFSGWEGEGRTPKHTSCTL